MPMMCVCVCCMPYVGVWGGWGQGRGSSSEVSPGFKRLLSPKPAGRNSECLPPKPLDTPDTPNHQTPSPSLPITLRVYVRALSLMQAKFAHAWSRGVGGGGGGRPLLLPPLLPPLLLHFLLLNIVMCVFVRACTCVCVHTVDRPPDCSYWCSMVPFMTSLFDFACMSARTHTQTLVRNE